MSHPNKTFTTFLLSGLREGFDTGISKLPEKSFECQNLRSAIRDPVSVSSLVNEELLKGYLIGPYSKPPFDHYRINPIGIVESKYSLKKRLIVDLSAPYNNTDHPSLNSLIDKETYSLSYVTVDDAIKRIQELGSASWMNKTDIQDAFKLLPINPSLWPFYGIKWNQQYYFFVRLPFGSRSSPKLFDMLSEAIVWIAEHNYGITKMLHLLDDFFVVDSTEEDGWRTKALLTLLFSRIKVPLSEKKTVGPVQVIEYLGIILDSQRMEARLPVEKLSRIIQMIKSLLNRRKCKKRELLSVLGHMSFASRVVVPGRSFVHYLFNLTTYVRSLESHVTFNRQSQLELEMWYRHLSDWNGIFFFLDPKTTSSIDLQFSTDASSTVGCGAVFGNEWFSHQWSADMINLPDSMKSTALLEIIPIVIAAAIWGSRWERKRILLFCDNQATVNIVNKGRSSSSFIMSFMRRLTLFAMQHHFLLRAVYISSLDNGPADALSRFQLTRFRELVPSANHQSQAIPPMNLLTFPPITSITL
jgi:Reverse transcriptase (RNA-dependent DNA polymerase)